MTMKFRKGLAVLLAAGMLAGCGSKKETVTVVPTTAPTAAQTEPEEPEFPMMTWEEFEAAGDGARVRIETCIQEKETFWENTANLYTQTEDGGCLIYGLECTNEEYRKLTAGTRLDIEGIKQVWDGKLVILGGSYSIGGEKYTAEAQDVTGRLGTEALRENLLQKVCFRDVTVCMQGPEEESEKPDICFLARQGNGIGKFRVDADLIPQDSECYETAQGLQEGDRITVTGILDWNSAGPELLVTEIEMTITEQLTEQ